MSFDKYGKLCEEALNEFVCNRYGVKHEKYQFATFDWFPVNYEKPNQVELKTRSCRYEDFENITANDIKINKAKRVYGAIDSYFLYWFSNGDLYEWKYDPSIVLPREVNGDPNRVGHIKERPHIPRHLMTKIGNFKLPPNPRTINRGKCLLYMA
jgi:hypothetical protein